MVHASVRRRRFTHAQLKVMPSKHYSMASCAPPSCLLGPPLSLSLAHWAYSHHRGCHGSVSVTLFYKSLQQEKGIGSRLAWLTSSQDTCRPENSLLAGQTWQEASTQQQGRSTSDTQTTADRPTRSYALLPYPSYLLLQLLTNVPLRNYTSLRDGTIL